ncbi:putative transcriptional regulator [Pseudochelatococcus lubricantis]|uniref:Transcriptional regulator n=1 Tax=Pseudochelatococcus lubricantis TaxID=1538102 RepID=A0ABX0V6R8_9HYPH|nr:MucR family transcriptional regulator [Pseudochelatococcus lubricantis]NIJ60164.1 putative transcriptional regulator [Pseudochelatococcus lubricantis]
MSAAETPDLTTLTVQLLSAYVGHNAVPSSELAQLIRTTRAALAGYETSSAPQQPEPESKPEYVPAVSVRTSLASPDHLISLIDGKPYKTLKRHLATHGLTPAEYRARYNLPADYPLVAPNYSKQRQEAAKLLGLGRRKSETATEADVPPPEEPVIADQVPETSVAEPKSRARAKAASTGSSRSGRVSRKKAPTGTEVVEPVSE